MPKKIRKLFGAAQGASKMDLDELLGRLPQGTPAQQLEARLMFERLKAERDALYPKAAPATETGKTALAEAKKTLTKKQAPSVIIPSKVSNVEQAIRESKGEYGAKRVQRAADQIKNLERLYTEEALRTAFGGDNAKALMIMDPANFEKFAAPLVMRESAMSGSDNLKYSLPTNEYINHLAGINEFKDIPFLQINKKEEGLPLIPFISGHEGRHRSRAMVQRGEPTGLVQIYPGTELRYFPRNSQEEYLEALKKELEMTNNLVSPETYFDNLRQEDVKRPDIKLPEIFAEGGLAHMAGGGKALRKALKTISNVGKAEKSMEAARNLMQANRPLSLAERQFVAEVAARQAEELASLRPKEVASIETKGKSRGATPKPARAKPKTKAEINAIAERVAPQMLGEFVRQPGKTESVTGKSRKQFDLEQELQHEMQRSRDVPDVATVDLEPHVGSVMLSLPGDTSISDYDIFSIGGNRLREPARQYGGPRFGLGHPEEAGWASGFDQAAGFQRRVNAASQQYGDVPVLANYLAMGPEGLNYATHFTDTLLKGIDPTKMSKKDIEDFNRMMRYGRQNVHMPDFPGIENPEAAYLYLANNPVGRKLVFNPTMQLVGTTEGFGLPSGLNVRHAITEPELRDIEPGMTGFSLLQMEPGVMGLKPSAHPTYSHDIPGKFLGRTDVLMPYELTFPDTVAGIRANPKQAGSEFGTLQMLGGKQIIDQQLLDEIGEYRRRIKELTGKKDGGVVHMQGGGDPGEVSGEMFSPKPLTIPAPLTDLADMIRRQFSKEKRTSQKPGTAQDVILGGYVAPIAGAPGDFLDEVGQILDHVQKTHPLMREKASVMDTGPERTPPMGYAPKVRFSAEGNAPYGSEQIRGGMERYGLISDERRPLLEIGTSLLAPFGAVKALKYGKALAPTAADIMETQLLRATEPMRMNIVPEGGPSGKVKAPANELGFYNPVEKAALNVQRKQGTGSAMVSDLKKTPGVNDERLAELGLGDLASRQNVTREELLAATQENRIPLRETVARERDETAINELEEEYANLAQQFEILAGQGKPEEVTRISAALDKNLAEQNRLKSLPEARFGPATSPDYSLPGGENYREIRVALPSNRPSIKNMSREEYNASVAKADAEGVEDFFHTIHHGDEPNVLFHLRVADHVDADGKKGLLIDELQSDWHQKGRDKGYGRQPSTFMLVNPETSGAVGNFATKEEAEKFLKTSPRAEEFAQGKFFVFENKGKVVVPDAPFKDNWYQLGLKRAIKEAADTGMDRVYLTTGARQADRYDLSKRVSHIDYRKSSVYDKYELGIVDINGDPIELPKERYSAEELQDIVGKEVADKIIKGEGQSGDNGKTLSGLDLKVGGEGMKQYYDKNYKNFLDKYAKQFGARIGETKIPSTDIMEHWPEFRDWFAQKYGDRGSALAAHSQWSQGRNNKNVREFEKQFPKEYEPVYYIDITPKMRESAKIGQSYKDGGAVRMAEGGAVDYESVFNQMLQDHVGMAAGGAVDYESRFNDMLQKHVQGLAEGGEVNEYNSDPDMSDGGRFIPAPAFADGGAVKSIWTVN